MSPSVHEIYGLCVYEERDEFCMLAQEIYMFMDSVCGRSREELSTSHTKPVRTEFVEDKEELSASPCQQMKSSLWTECVEEEFC